MDSVFIYWDNSDIFHEVQRLAEERSEGPGGRNRVRLNFERLAHQTVQTGFCCRVGSTGTAANRMGVEVLRGSPGRVNRKCLTVSCNSACWKTRWTITAIRGPWYY